MLNFSVGIMAYNEGQNIARLLQAIQNQKLSSAEISSITVVASGCTDRTEEIVRDISKKDSRIRLIHQDNREGKSSAINLWLKNTTSELLLLESADTIPDESSFEKIIAPFGDKTIGMAGAHPIPINNPLSLMGFAAHLLWKLHHIIALNEPKMGETIAFRNIIKSIPKNSAVDEANIEAEITKRGYRVIYVPEATVKNKGPETMADFIRQRRRIHSGHLWLKKNFSHQVSTMNGFKIFQILVKNFHWSVKEIIFTLLIIALEIWGRLLGWYDFKIAKKNTGVWKIASSTKNLTDK